MLSAFESGDDEPDASHWGEEVAECLFEYVTH